MAILLSLLVSKFSDSNNDSDSDDGDDDENAGVIPEPIEDDNAGVSDHNDDENAGVHDEHTTDDNINEMMNERYGPRNHQYNLRNRRARDYSHLHIMLDTPMCMITEQMNIKQGLKTFGKTGAEAVVAEMQQLHSREVIMPVKSESLTRDQRRNALRYLMFLKQKRCGKVKARGCADGRKQRVYKTKDETSAPTVHTESLFLSSVIDAKEGRQVVTCDIPGAFMHADMDELLHLKLEGPLAELLTKVDPKLYSPYITKERGNKVLYVVRRTSSRTSHQGGPETLQSIHH